jgi:membrane fusion protein (multidrug efflux system)
MLQGVPVSTLPAIKRSAMIKPLIIMLVIVAALLALIAVWHAFVGKMIKQGMAKGAAAPAAVATTKAMMTSWQAHTQAVGSVRAVRGADLSAQASGVVDQISFESGNQVGRGAVLLRLRPNDDPAKLAQLQAEATLAEQTLSRDKEQLAAQAISQATVDTDVANLASAQAQVAQQRALIDEKIVRAPFAGRLGIRQIDEGQYLTAGATIVTLQALDPIFIDFYLPQQELASLKHGEPVTATVDAYPGVSFPGVIASINSKVDSASRNVQVRGSFPNPGHKLVPGMYATVQIDEGPAQSLLTLPQTAISYNPYGDVVYIVEQKAPDQKGTDQKGTEQPEGPQLVAQQRFVKLGPTRGDQVAVESGLVAGDTVVTAGQMKLHNGSSVIVNNSVQPTDNPAPTPPNQ